jgi:hypothetical protein
MAEHFAPGTASSREGSKSKPTPLRNKPNLSDKHFAKAATRPITKRTEYVLT